jgi:PncC family amidohydrolase
LDTSFERANVQGASDTNSTDDFPASVVARLLIERGATVSAAESCTGGLLSAALTDIPGSSAYFPGGMIVYDNDVKTGLLGVRPETIAEHGAVSAPVALEMARQIRATMRTDIGLGVTGIAGPDGGTAAKPVGTTFIALVEKDAAHVRHFTFSGDRAGNRADSVRSALTTLALYLQSTPATAQIIASQNEVSTW